MSRVVLDEKNKPHIEHVDCYSNFTYQPISKKEATKILQDRVDLLEKEKQDIKSLIDKLKE